MDAVLVTPSCCDPLCRRAVRVSMGTVFQVPWARLGEKNTEWPAAGMDRLRKLGFKTAAMALDDRAVSVEEIQDMVEHHIMAHGAFEVAKHYITYRYTRSLVRRSNTTDDKILSLIECNNEEAKQENSNKNPVVNSTQRDYMAGEVSRDITNRLLLPREIVEAHEEGIIHFHDTDYYAQHMHNCDLVNLEDMLQNGTVITGTLIERPHSFATACNIATQIVAQVASNQYGGQSISLTHLAPFVEVSRQKIRKIVQAEMDSIGFDPGEEKIHELVETRLREEIRRGVQTIQYQVVTLLTTNGQAPFITVFMYLNEAHDEREKKDLAMIVEEMLLQRYQGVKNEQGVWVTPAFPKLIYVLEEDNIHEDAPYWYLTELAAKCTARRMVPDYISEKKMKELKGDVYTCMGCRSFLSPWKDENGNYKFEGRFNQGVVSLNLPQIGILARGDEEGLEEELAILRHLSSQVAGLTEEGEEAPLSVTWDDSQIDIHTAGTYELTGTISVPPEAAGQYVLPGSCSTIRNSVRVYAEEGLTLALSNEQTGGLSYAGAGKPWDL